MFGVAVAVERARIASFHFMSAFDEGEKEAAMMAMLEKLVEFGWIEQLATDDRTGAYALKWTAKGRERAQWLRTITSELELGPKMLTALMVICELHGD